MFSNLPLFIYDPGVGRYIFTSLRKIIFTVYKEKTAPKCKYLILLTLNLKQTRCCQFLTISTKSVL